jgi:hypothetical protein
MLSRAPYLANSRPCWAYLDTKCSIGRFEMKAVLAWARSTLPFARKDMFDRRLEVKRGLEHLAAIDLSSSAIRKRLRPRLNVDDSNQWAASDASLDGSFKAVQFM